MLYRRFIRVFSSDRGAVSVYFAVIVAAIFFFNAVLIDFARIKLAEKQSEHAVKAAVRSVLSAYQPEVQTYGLYGLGVDKEQEDGIFTKVMGENVSSGLRMENGSAVVTNLLPLGDHRVFEQQVLEEMKYRAPIEFTIGVIDKFSAESPNIQRMHTFTQEAVKVDKLIKQRENELDDAWKQVEMLYGLLEEKHAAYAKTLREMGELAEAIGSARADEVDRKMDSVRRELRSVSGDPDNRGKASALRAELSRLRELLSKIRTYEQLAAEMKSDTEKAVGEAEALAEGIGSLLNKAADTEQRIVREIGEIKGKLEGGEGPSGNRPEDVFSSIKIRGGDYYRGYHAEMSQIAALFVSFAGKVRTQLPDSLSGLESANELYYARANPWFAARQSENSQRKSENNDIERMKEEQRGKAQHYMDKALNDVQKWTSGCADSDAGQYAKLAGKEGLFSHYSRFNDIKETGDPGNPSEIHGSAKDLGIYGLSLANELMSKLDTVMNELYINEYALTKFNYATLGKGSMQSAELSRPADHPLKNQEAEYVLYGLSSCRSNIFAAYAELFMFRLSLRTVETLSDPKKAAAGSPMLVFLIALAEAAGKAYADMGELAEGKAVPLMERTAAIKLHYKDYLRLFLLLHGNNPNIMARMQALIQLNTGHDLTQTPTYVQGTANTSIRLWFIPSLIRLLHAGGVVDGTVSGARYYMSKTASSAY